MKRIFFIVFTFYFLSAGAQIFTLDFSIKNIPVNKVYLLSFYGDDNKLVDSLSCIGKDGFLFKFSDKNPTGLYRIFIDRETTIDIVFNKENIQFETDYLSPVDSMKVIQSEENKLYYEFLSKDQLFQRKLELINPLLSNYPKTDAFYQDIKKQYTILQKDRDKFVKDIYENNKKLFVSKIFNIKRTPLIDPELNELERMDFLKMHFWENVNFHDTALFRTNVFTSKVLAFLMLYSNRRLPPHLQEEAFIEAVDVILPKAKVNQKAYEFILNFLMSGFENFKFEKVLAHISSHYKVETSCENEERKTTLQKRLESYQLLNIGKIAPEISAPDADGKLFSMNSLTSDYILVVFWATWCPHCTEMMPEINKIFLAQNTKRFDVIAFSLDTNKIAWKDFINKNNLNWNNLSDFKSWDSKISDEYCIYATPTMFLLDKKRKILAKPLTAPELLESLQQLKILKD